VCVEKPVHRFRRTKVSSVTSIRQFLKHIRTGIISKDLIIGSIEAIETELTVNEEQGVLFEFTCKTQEGCFYKFQV